jgi:hypothetical protein
MFSGYNNIITLTSTKSQSDDSMKLLDKTERNCLFPEENNDLKIYKQYSYYNCKFECGLFYAQLKVFKKYKNLCQPWFFPTSDESFTFCNPWESFDFLQIMSDEIPDNLCSHCLPDCIKTSYNTKQIAIPFPYCNLRNIGANQFCKLGKNKPLPMTDRFGKQINNDQDLEDSLYERYVPMGSSDRYNQNKNGDIFIKKLVEVSDAFKTDVAVIELFYQKPTALVMGSQLTMTWIEYFATVGGLLGLVLGMGLVSFIEIIWLLLRIAARKLNRTDYIT